MLRCSLLRLLLLHPSFTRAQLTWAPVVSSSAAQLPAHLLLPAHTPNSSTMFSTITSTSTLGSTRFSTVLACLAACLRHSTPQQAATAVVVARQTGPNCHHRHRLPHRAHALQTVLPTVLGTCHSWTGSAALHPRRPQHGRVKPWAKMMMLRLKRAVWCRAARCKTAQAAKGARAAAPRQP